MAVGNSSAVSSVTVRSRASTISRICVSRRSLFREMETALRAPWRNGAPWPGSTTSGSSATTRSSDARYEPIGSVSKPRSKVTGGDTTCSRWSPEHSSRSAALHRQTCPGEWPGVCTISHVRSPTVTRSPPSSSVLGRPIEGITGSQSHSPREVSVSSGP